VVDFVQSKFMKGDFSYRLNGQRQPLADAQPKASRLHAVLACALCFDDNYIHLSIKILLHVLEAWFDAAFLKDNDCALR